MFSQFGVPKGDQPPSCLFCGGNTSRLTLWHMNIRIIYLVLKTHPLVQSMRCSAQTARGNVRKKLKDVKNVFRNFYMDHYLKSMECPEDALFRLEQLVQTLHLGRNKLYKFGVNVPDLAGQIDGSSELTELKVITSSK